jgi:multidrug efflux pump subunit AcrA (membrane-fusion protein)
LAVLAACGGKPEPSAAPEPKPAEAKSEPGEVRLSEALQKTAGIETRQVETRAAPVTLRLNGRVVANEERTHKAGTVTDGRVMDLLANVGDRVQRGQVLARLHSHDVHESRSAYQKAKVELSRLEAQRLFAERNRDRLRRLFDLKAASREQLEYAENELRNTLAGIEAAKLELRRTRQHLEEFLDVPAEEPGGQKQSSAPHQADWVPVKAPAAGVVIARSVSTGSVAQPGTDLFLISDLSTVWMLAALPEDQLSRVRVGTPAQVFVRAFEDRPFPGRITLIGDQLDAVTRTVQLRVTLANPRGELKPEMYASAEIATGGSSEAMFVPQEALQELSGQNIVFIAGAGDRFQLRAVETGARVGGMVTIVSGLKPEDRVVTRGAFVLKSEMLKSTLAEE